MYITSIFIWLNGNKKRAKTALFLFYKIGRRRMKKHNCLLCLASCLSSMFYIIKKKYVLDMSEMKKKYEHIYSYFIMEVNEQFNTEKVRLHGSCQK